jgi:signal transduction histidine kinase
LVITTSTAGAGNTVQIALGGHKSCSATISGTWTGTLVVESSGAGPVVLGDPILLEWALESLVRNAIDALKGQSGTITLSTGVDGPNALLRVQDDGPGVAREIRRTLFDPGITTKSGGWGVGLALARRVVEDGHAGELALETTERGASFLIRIPMHAQS